MQALLSSHTEVRYPEGSPKPHLEDLEKYLRKVIPDWEKNIRVVWRIHLPAEYPDSLKIHLLGYTSMQTDLTVSPSDYSRYAREVFRITSTVQQQKLVEEDPHGAIDTMVSYLHHASFIAGVLKDKHDKENLQLEGGDPCIPPSKAAIIERDFFKSQVLARNRTA